MNNQILFLKPQVVVRCPTYNHAPYIVETMDGFCKQQTSFPFVCTIIDDCSTDGEQEVIRQYVQEHFDLIDKTIIRNGETDDYVSSFARHKINRNCYFVVLYLKYNHTGIGKSSRKWEYIKDIVTSTEYIAVCEGDDYWTDPLKLQKQVDFLELHPECMMCCSNGVSFSESSKTSNIINPVPVQSSCFLTVHQLFVEENPLIPTASMCYRKEMHVNMPVFFKKAPVGDRPIRMWCAINGKIFYHVEPMITYRSGSLNCYTQRVKKNKSYAKNVYKRMIDFYNTFDDYTKCKYHDDVEYMRNREAYVYYTNIADFKHIIFAKHLYTYSFANRTKIRIKCFVKLIPGVYPLYLKLNTK